ncbi:IclR family transcriptional regulator domain-containing protein [Streptomyces antimycoticus]
MGHRPSRAGLSGLCAVSGLPLPDAYARGLRIRPSAARPPVCARPRLVEECGETANMALLDGDETADVAQVPSRHSTRMFTEVGRRALPHSTGMGKAVFAGFTGQEGSRPARPYGHARHRGEDEHGFLTALEDIRRLGYAVDDEQEIGVRCLAASVPDSPTAAAISISGPAGRVTAPANRRCRRLSDRTARRGTLSITTERPQTAVMYRLRTRPDVVPRAGHPGSGLVVRYGADKGTVGRPWHS